MSRVYEYEEVGAYFREISRFPVLTYEQEIELSERIKKNDNDAFNELIRSNLRLVVRIAKNYRGQGISFIDLIAEGNVGLVKAAGKYDSSKSKFSSYSAWWIKQAIMRAINNKSRLIRLPDRKSEAVINFRRNYLVSGKDGNILSAKEISEEINFPYDELKRLLTMEKITSLESLTNDGIFLSDSIRDTRENSEEEGLYGFFKRDLSSALKSVLNARELEIIQKRFGLERYHKYTLKELSEEYSLSRERIRQIEQKAIGKLRNNPDIRRLVSY